MEKVPMLAEGYEKLTAELKLLRAERPKIVDAIEEARAHGDLSENAEYHAAKERQGQIEAHISDIEGKVTRAQLEEIATIKMADLTASDMEAAVRTIAGSARAAGIEVEGV